MNLFHNLLLLLLRGRPWARYVAKQGTWLMCCLPHKNLFSAGQGALEEGRAPAKRVS